MILTCPACSTRYQVDEAKFPPAGRSVRCAKCGHVWHQPGPGGEAAEAGAGAAADGLSGSAAQTASAAEAGADAHDINQTLARFRTDMAAKSNAAAAAKAEKKRSLLPLLGIALGWSALIAAVLLIGYAAVRYRQEIAVVWPQSAGVYEKLGLKLNTQGLDFTNVNYHREGEDGEVVLAVTGQIVNASGRELPVPQSVRVSLADSSNHELYHWNFTPPVQSLKPGQSAPFTTRLSSPPAGARHLEVRFAPPGS
jgi:predicted Zn finger-like uncharacterized protein